MRTKTTILSAVALAAGLLSASAQVYSANVVGYINRTIPANGYAFAANQLVDTNFNKINGALAMGAVSDPNGALNTVVQIWNGAAHPGFSVYTYWSANDAFNNFGNFPQSYYIDGYYNGDGTIATASLTNGYGAFIFNGQSTNITLTFVGQVNQGPISIPIPAGNSALSIVPPVVTNIDSALIGFVGNSDPNGANNDLLEFWQNPGFNVLTYWTGPDALNNFGNFPAPYYRDGFYDGTGLYQSTNAAYFPKIGEAFFIFHAGAPKTWSYNFTVQ